MTHNLKNGIEEATMFTEYRNVYNAMGNDKHIKNLHLEIVEAERDLHELQAELAKAEAPYREALKEAEARITKIVLAEGHSVTLFGVEAKYAAGRRSTAWKSVAGELNPPTELVEKYTTVGDPSVTVRVLAHG